MVAAHGIAGDSDAPVSGAIRVELNWRRMSGHAKRSGKIDWGCTCC
jgi:hypothetical protein